MEKMISLKVKNKEKLKTAGVAISKPSEPQYPYGTRLELNEETLEKLGIEDADVGDVFEITAKAKVVSASESKYENEKARQNMCLQITDLAMTAINEDTEKVLDEKEVLGTIQKMMERKK